MNEAQEFLSRQISINDKVVVACSGGPDSMALLNLVIELRKKIPFEIICAHVNHKKRKESEEEYEFVKEYCHQNKVIFEGTTFDTYNQKNFHDEAHNKRQQFFQSLIHKYQAKYLLTAHHGDDLVETILMRLSRGASFFGYHGFSKIEKEKDYTILRPLITMTKEEIFNEVIRRKIPYRIDKTNEMDTYTRNRYRKYILPFLKKENKNVHLKYLKFSEELCQINEFLVKTMEKTLTDCIENDTLHIVEMKSLSSFQQRYVIKAYLKQIYQENRKLLKDVHVDKIMEMIQSEKPNQVIHLPLQKLGIKNYQIFKIIEKNTLEKYFIELNESANIKGFGLIKKVANEEEKSNNVIRLNSQEIKLPLFIRTRKDKDKIAIKNMEGHQKIKDLFINAKIPKEKRDTWPIVVDANDEIIWVPALKKSKFDKEKNEKYDIIYKYVFSEEKRNVTKK